MQWHKKELILTLALLSISAISFSRRLLWLLDNFVSSSSNFFWNVWKLLLATELLISSEEERLSTTLCVKDNTEDCQSARSTSNSPTVLLPSNLQQRIILINPFIHIIISL